MRRGRASGWTLAILLLAAAPAASAASPVVAWPPILDPGDAGRYRTIFALQSAAEWQAADAVIAELHDRLLVGPVLAERYLSRHYPTRYDEAAAWLAHHADESEAPAIHRLALARHPRGAPAPPAPVVVSGTWRAANDDPVGFRPPEPAAIAHPTAAQAASEQLKSAIRRAAKADPGEAAAMLDAAAAAHRLDDTDFDEVRATLAEAELSAGRYAAALRLAGMSRTAAFQPLAHWVAGLADWGLGHLDDARTHFEALARRPDLSPWNVAAAAFWAARVHFTMQHHDLDAYWLGEAAHASRTFYGMLARSLLGEPPDPGIVAGPARADDFARIAAIPAGRRALALLQIGQRGPAEAELRIAAGAASPALLAALVSLADRATLPALSLELATQIGDGALRDRALYPLPRWRPADGFRLDPALLLAFMRQESQFRPETRSAAGAVGLMQLMWETARQMAPQTGVALTDPQALCDPSINLALGQAYLRHLLGQPAVGGNLVLLAAAYNLGPHRFAERHSTGVQSADPLFFLETLPSRETRVFVERVMVNYWIYQLRLGRPARGLDRLAAGGWPLYADGVGPGGTRHAAR